MTAEIRDSQITTITNHYVKVRTDKGGAGGEVQWIEIRESKGRNGIFLPKRDLTEKQVTKWDEHNRRHRELEVDDDHKATP